VDGDQEIVSGAETAAVLDEKVSEYLAHGAAEVWLIYPKQRHAWVYSGTPVSARCETQSIRGERLPGIELR